MTTVESHGDAAFAAGKRGVLLERSGPNEWETLVRKGPTGNGHGLLGAAPTDDGKRLWYCGNSGSFGYYDRVNGTVEPRPGPANTTSAMQSINVEGKAGEERVVAVDNAGQVVDAQVDGTALAKVDVRSPADGTAFTEIVEDGGNLFAADVAGYLYFSRNGANWRRRRLATTTLKGLAVDDNGVAAITDGGKVFTDISLFEQQQRTRTAEFGTSSPEDITAKGGVYVISGCDGCVVPVNREGEANHRKPGPGVTFYGVEIMDDGTVLAAGTSGKIVEGHPKN